MSGGLHETPDRTHNFLKTSQKNSCASKADGQEFDSELQLAAGKSRRKMFIFMATSRGEVAARGKWDECVWAQAAPAQSA